MNEHDQLTQQSIVLYERISQLNAAMLRITASLDVGTVLRETVESARTLTTARYGTITVVDAAGSIEDLAHSGFAPEEFHRLLKWPDGTRFFEHLRDLDGPMRMSDLLAYVRSLGFSSEPLLSKTFQVTPMRHRGVHVGNIFLAEKEDGQEFTTADEEILELFATPAAAAIANARTHREEQRERADIAALIETLPVGVMVFEARTGTPVSFNREASRIVEALWMPGQPSEKLLGSITCRRADGRGFTLDEVARAHELRTAKTVRAEEIVLSVPGGRSIRTLANAVPIQSANGEVETVVVTMQDLAPLEDLERLRAEFLSMVSHELRTPLTSIKGSASTVLDSARGVDPEVLQFFRIINDQANLMDSLISDLLAAGRIDAGTLSVAPEPTVLATLVEQARTTFLSGGGRHAVVIDLSTELPKVMADRRRIVQVLNNLLSNAARHSPTSFPIRVSAERDAVFVAVSISDQGRGVAPELLPRLFQKHTVGDDGLTRTGLGLAICKGLVEAHGGRIRAESDGPGRGTRVTFTIPIADGGSATPASASNRPGATCPAREPAPIVVVDDDPHTLRFVRDALKGAGYASVVTGDPAELSGIIAADDPQLVLLDLMLPGTDGLKMLESVPELSELPVIFMSGYERGETVARALELGASDYIVKPFSAPELTARVGAALRKRAEAEPFVLGDLVIRYEDHHVTVAGRTVRLTATEYELLRLLAVNAGRTLSYESLLRRIWRGRGDPDVQRLRTFVRTLRRKLGDDATTPAWVVNERGVGYRMPRPGRA
ncbi:MAG: response regulator [Spirochaetaceae bacterium]|nr:response regulator [Spirochaetaceae bacterium]MDE0228720.1 response regulator [Spirochaetaceae bacterium]